MPNEATYNPDLECLQVSPCSGVILYQWDGRSFHMDVGVTMRNESVGAGLGISFGGHAEALEFLRRPVGSMASILAEAYREGEEELGAKALHRAIAQDVLETFAQPLGTSMVRVDWEGKQYVHVPAYYVLPVTAHERLMLGNLRDTDERVGQILWLRLCWRRALSLHTTSINEVWLEKDGACIGWNQFYHGHEPVLVFRPLAILANTGRLWNDRRKNF